MIDVNPDLLAFLKEEEIRSRNQDLLDRAEVALNSYNGDLYGDEEDGRSKVVTRDVAEVIDHMEVSVLRVFVSGDRVVEFEPLDESQSDAADDATEAIHRQFQRKGYQLLHDWFKEGNISTLGIVKTAAEQRRERVESVMPSMLMPDDALEASPVEGDESGLDLHHVATMQDKPVEFRDYLVPIEEFRISRDARDIDDAVYVAHASVKTLGDLVAMGFDTEDVTTIPSYHHIESLSTARDTGLDFSADRKGANRKVILYEEYVRFDADDDGIAERLCVHRVGDTILRIEPTDYQPFVIYCPFPMPGRIAGHSLAEKVTDIQRVRTVLQRLHLDGLYTNLAPGYLVHEDSATENTYDDLLTVRPNRIVRWKGSVAPMPESKNDVSAVAMAAMEQLIGERESRTGVTRMNQGLDADALNKTATGTALMQAQGQQMEEYLARNFAEALARLMRLKLKLMSRYGKPMKMRVDGTFREVDPSQWPEEMDVITRVGLGSGKKEQRLIYRMQVLQIQRECMMAGLPIVGPEQIYKSISGVVKDSSLGSPADFVIDPSSPEFQQAQANRPPPPPDPHQMKVQGEMQLQQAKIEGEQQIAQARLQHDAAAAEQAQQFAQTKAESDAQLARDKANAELQLAEQKFAVEARIAEHKMMMAEMHHERDQSRLDAANDAKISKDRSGGALDK